MLCVSDFSKLKSLEFSRGPFTVMFENFSTSRTRVIKKNHEMSQYILFMTAIGLSCRFGAVLS